MFSFAFSCTIQIEIVVINYIINFFNDIANPLNWLYGFWLSITVHSVVNFNYTFVRRVFSYTFCVFVQFSLLHTGSFHVSYIFVQKSFFVFIPHFCPLTFIFMLLFMQDKMTWHFHQYLLTYLPVELYMTHRDIIKFILLIVVEVVFSFLYGGKRIDRKSVV